MVIVGGSDSSGYVPLHDVTRERCFFSSSLPPPALVNMICLRRPEVRETSINDSETGLPGAAWRW